jgi:tripartite-type tricarboxylate transporter receptor subunit TctC
MGGKALKITRRVAAGGLAALPFAPSLTGAQAQQNFPNRPCTLVVPFPAGGPADIFGRNLAERISPFLGQPVVVENKSGAAGVTGVDFVAKSNDPHVMGLMSASAGAIMQSLMPKMPFEAKDIAPQLLVVRVQEVFAVSSKLGINDLKSFIAYAKANPGKVTCGSAGTGGITHLAIELFKRETGIDLLHVPYRGAAPATNDLLSGTVDTVLLDISVLIPHARSGAIKVLAVTSDTRPPLMPEVPTMREMGYPKVNSDNWYALISPAAAPADAREKIFDAATAALKTKEIADAYSAAGGVVGGGTTEELKTFLREEGAKWAEVVKSANVKLE